jgi:nicotinate-nucleotide pyrophosphorylase (carboxylating)
MISSALLDDVVRRALSEDLSGGDLTAEAVIDENARAVADAIAKSELVACGAEVFARTFYAVDPGVRVEQLVPDGTLVSPGTVLWRVEGRTRSLLAAERTALNFVQRLSGTATITRRFVDALPQGSPTRIVDTRKTTPGLRMLERYAVRAGGGKNHRDCLGSAVLIKDNHIAAAGSIAEAVRRARDHAPHTSRIEIEVDTLEQLDEALRASADIVMLDNFDDHAIRVALERTRGKAMVEISGGITLPRVAHLGALGVDVISVGALTHSAPASDISLDLKPVVAGPA